MNTQLWFGDCQDFLPKIESNSVDLTITSPPYDNLRTYKDTLEWNENIWKEIIRELYRITKVGGVVVWVTGDSTVQGSETGTSFKQALWAKECGFNLHDTMIYRKETPIPQFKCHRYTNAFEFMFIFSKGAPKKGTLITEPTKSAGRVDRNYRGQVDRHDNYVGTDLKVVKEDKLLTNIWTYSQNNDIDKSIKHKAQFPEMLAYDHIVSWSDEGDIVLDPMMGAGTVGKLAKLLHRNFIGIEKVKSYFDSAEKRISKITS